LKKRAPAAERLDNPRNLLSSLILVFPLLLVYQVGVLFTLPMLNGADFVTTFLFRDLGFDRWQYLAFVGVVCVLFLAAVALLRRKQRWNAAIVLPVLLESTIYALTMGSLIVLVMTKLLGLSPRLAAGLAGEGLLTRFVMSLGAGVYEELVFRLFFLGGMTALCVRFFGWGRWFAVIVTLLVSSVAFSAVHHVGAAGDPFSMGIFTFRILAGVSFGLLFLFRGFAVAVYTHAIYDVYVLLLQ
jgi:membrane protease YdiL (CAAX protease family)